MQNDEHTLRRHAHVIRLRTTPAGVRSHGRLLPSALGHVGCLTDTGSLVRSGHRLSWLLGASRSSLPTAINGRARGLEETRPSCSVIATSMAPRTEPRLAPRGLRDSAGPSASATTPAWTSCSRTRASPKGGPTSGVQNSRTTHADSVDADGSEPRPWTTRQGARCRQRRRTRRAVRDERSPLMGSVPRDAGSERQPGPTRGALTLWIVGFID
jgi:hypothetical protein